MSLLPHDVSDRPVFNPDGFVTKEEQASYVIEQHLKGAVVGEPFLLITRFLKNQMHRSGRCPIYRNDLVETYYFGIFSDKKPLIFFQKDKRHKVGNPQFLMTSVQDDCICLSTGSYVVIENWRSLFPYTGELALSLGLMDETQLKGTFRPPEGQCLPFLISGQEEVSAFSFAVGSADMEHLCLAEQNINREMILGYLRAAALLDIPLLSKLMQEERESFGRKFVEELLAEHQKLSRAQHVREEDRNNMASRVSVAKQLGFGKDTWEVRVEGIRHRPCDLVPDLVALYPEKAVKK